jgi:hypothetical protein
VLAQEVEHGRVVRAAVHQVQHVVAERQTLRQAVRQGVGLQEERQRQSPQLGKVCPGPGLQPRTLQDLQTWDSVGETLHGVKGILRRRMSGDGGRGCGAAAQCVR